MKKLGIFCAALLALGFASCDDKSDLGVAQVNPQETVMSANGVTVEYGSALVADQLNLDTFDGGEIPVINLVSAQDLPEGAAVSFEMQLASKADYSDAVTLPVENGAVQKQAWDDFFRATLGRSPKAKDNYVRFAAYISYDGQYSRVGTADTWFAAKKMLVTPVRMDFVIEENYYLIGTINNWALNEAYPFKHTDADVYDDPNFTITVDITEEQAADGWWWKVPPASATASGQWDNVIGTVVNGDEALEGTIKQGKKDDEAQAGCIKEAGTYLMTINMEDMTYSFKKMEYLYTPGNSNNWSQAASQPLYYNADKKVYMGYAHLSGEFKFSSQADWNGTNYGSTGEDGTLSTDGGAGNLNAAQDGLYWLEVDTENLTYKAVLVTSLGAIGDMNSWGAQEALSPSADFLVWTGDITFTAADNAFKFRANDNWDINLGGSFSNLVWNGDNMVAPGVGTYTVTLDLRSIPYTCSAVAK